MARRTAGNRLRGWRRSRGVTQEELAHELDFAHGPAIHKRETGEVAMDEAALMDALAAVTRIAKRKAAEMTLTEVLAGE